jgi:hypothetical protein
MCFHLRMLLSTLFSRRTANRLGTAYSYYRKGWETLFWADVAAITIGSAAAIAPEALNLRLIGHTNQSRLFAEHDPDSSWLGCARAGTAV